MSSQSSFSLAPSSLTSPVTVDGQRSPWHSPVPYLFGGLAAMMGLIAFALLILACSYWKLSRNLRNAAERYLETGVEEAEEVKVDVNYKVVRVFEEMCVVIIAGEEKPTFLGKPSFGRTSSSSFGCSSCRSGLTTTSEMEKDEGSDQGQVSREYAE